MFVWFAARVGNLSSPTPPLCGGGGLEARRRRAQCVFSSYFYVFSSSIYWLSIGVFRIVARLQ
jgi:hypothetical protein